MSQQTQNQQKLPIRLVTAGSAKRLADLHLLQQDLDFAVCATDRLIQLYREDSEDAVLIQALYSSAVQAYIRCFTTGVRTELDPAIFKGLQGDPIACHQQILDIRNKHISHSVNPFEECQVGVVLSPLKATERQIVGVIGISKTLISMKEDGARNLQNLAKFARHHVTKELKIAKDTVLEELKNEDIEQLYTLPRPRLTGNDLGDERKVRPK